MNKVLTLKLVEEKAYNRDKDGKKKEAMVQGEQAYIRNDLSALQSLLSNFDTKTHAPKDWKSWTKIKDKVVDCYLNDKRKMELSLDEAGFLKDFLIDLRDKNTRDSKEKEKISFNEFQVRSLLGLIEQFEGVDK